MISLGLILIFLFSLLSPWGNLAFAAPTTINSLTSIPSGSDGSFDISFIATDADSCSMWIDPLTPGEQSIYSGTGTTGTANTGPLTTTGSHSVKVACWGPDAGYADATIILTCSDTRESVVNGVCERTRIDKYDNSTSLNYSFNVPDIHSLEYSVVVENDPGSNADLYLQLYDGGIDNLGQYF